MRKDILDKKDQILQWIQEEKPKSFIARQLNCKPDTLNHYLNQMEIKYQGNRGTKGYPKGHYSCYLTLDEYLKQSTNIQSNKVKKKILEEGLKPYKCECCELTTWMGEPIPLELHHKDGDKTHNELSNYELLCPNCHALTDTYRGKNIK